MATNRAAWLPFKRARPVKVDGAPMPVPTPDQIVVRVRSVAINPADVAVQNLGVVYEGFPVIMGCDAAGEVAEIGSGVQGFKKGDRVVVSVSSAAFQIFCPATPPMVAKIPHHISFSNACVLPLAFVTSTVCLFEEDMLGLAYPQVEPSPLNAKVVLIWGGSSALGSCAIQTARAAGYRVATTARRKNFEYCKGLGAEYVFDYTDKDVVSDVSSALKGTELAGTFCAIFAKGVVGACAQIADSLDGNKVVSVIYPPAMPIPDPLPEGVQVRQCWHSPLSSSSAAQSIFSSWLPAALANGQMKCAPEPEVVGQGLEHIQAALDRLAQGVSAKKIVVEIP